MRTTWKEEKLNELMRIPGVGKSIASDLWNLGIRTVDDLKGKSPEKLYEQSNHLVGTVQDRCLLYVFRGAVYYAETDPRKHEKAKLNWWYWKDKTTAFRARDHRTRKFLKLLSFSNE
jgi:nucleotidyltransferase/DNA polymerase involved in DNA repair